MPQIPHAGVQQQFDRARAVQQTLPRISEGMYPVNTQYLEESHPNPTDTEHGASQYDVNCLHMWLEMIYSFAGLWYYYMS
jgi:hypothetical protein